jgi:hypothetical protein
VIEPFGEELLGRVAEGRVADVVEEGGGSHQPSRAALLARLEWAAAALRQGVKDPAGELHRAQAVAEAAVLGAGEDQEGQTELPDPAQPLQWPAVDQRRFQRVGADEAVDRIAEREGGSGQPAGLPGRWTVVGTPGGGTRLGRRGVRIVPDDDSAGGRSCCPP